MTFTRGDSKIRIHREDPGKKIEIYCDESGTKELITDFDIPITKPIEIQEEEKSKIVEEVKGQGRGQGRNVRQR